jgi:EamA domain-containing membrane protein RarD
MNPILTPAIIRQAAASIAGTVLFIVATRLNVHLTEQMSADMIAAFTSLLSIAFYVAIRVLAKRWPWVEQLLLSANVPRYEQEKKR